VERSHLRSEYAIHKKDEAILSEERFSRSKGMGESDAEVA
jgi:hypothetical protein